MAGQLVLQMRRGRSVPIEREIEPRPGARKARHGEAAWIVVWNDNAVMPPRSFYHRVVSPQATRNEELPITALRAQKSG